MWSLGALLVGLGAIPAGWLSDKWSRSSDDGNNVHRYGTFLQLYVDLVHSKVRAYLLDLSILGLVLFYLPSCRDCVGN